VAAVAQLVGNTPSSTSANVNSSSTQTPQLVNLSATPPPPAQTNLTPASSAQPTDAAINSAQETTAAPQPSYARPAMVEKTPAAAQIINKVFGNGPATQPAAASAELRLMPAQQEMRVGEKQRLALTLISSAPLNSAMLRLRFDPRFIAVRGISQGDSSTNASTIMQSIDPSGIVTISVMPPAGVNFKNGASVLVFLDIEATAVGESALSFEKDNVHLSSAGSQVAPQLFESRILVK
jgi:hypothetical protein